MAKEINLPNDELRQLFPEGNFRLTDVSLFSVAPPDHAKVTKDILLKFYSESKLKDMVYVDGTSNVGGNVFPIIPLVKKLIAVEIDELTSQILKHNIGIAYPNIKNATVINEDFTKFDFEKHNPQILFVDPPWGGTKYKDRKDKELYLSGIPMAELFKTWAKYPDLIILRVPTLYPTKKLIKTDDIGYFKQVNIKNKSGRTIYKLLVFAQKSPRQKLKTNHTVKAVPYRFFSPTILG